jgi:glucose-6-phosphate 1-epimerase
MNNFAQLVPTALPSSVHVEAGAGNLPRLSIRAATAEAEVHFQGAHVTLWRPASSPLPVLWLSRHSRFGPGEAIRGGVPICFPWFSKHPSDRSAPPHGFARTRDWALVGACEDADGIVTLEMELAGEAVAPQWPHRFRARYRIVIGTVLRLDLEIANTGPDAFTFEEALHAYFDVGDIRAVTVSGLEGAAYEDKAGGGGRDHDGIVGPDAGPIRFAGLTNRVYPGTRDACVIHDPGRQRDLVIQRTGSNSTVVWNPWAERAREMSDFGDDEWTGMLCVEPGNVGADARTLGPGESHTMSVVVETRESAAETGGAPS